jgi:metacaspase-1
VNDANDLAERSKPFCATTTVVTNSKADRSGAHAAIKKFLGRLESGDIGIITLSSHGTREKIGSTYHEAIVWSDAELTYEKEVRQLLSEREKGSLLLLAGDLCHSGGLNRGLIRPRTIPAALTSGHTPPVGKTKPLSYLGWAGCKTTEFCYDATFDGRPNGAFTYYMLKASHELKRGATYHAWFMKIASQRGGYLPSDDYPQSPVEYGTNALKKRKVPF